MVLPHHHHYLYTKHNKHLHKNTECKHSKKNKTHVHCDALNKLNLNENRLSEQKTHKIKTIDLLINNKSIIITTLKNKQTKLFCEHKQKILNLFFVSKPPFRGPPVA